ncbi:MAG: IS1634 family transposase [Solobacterium sp.]|nr:IS1634 family transposase [Solobacterium sp.]MCH3962383.1 IS1634 family transposase [Solobacterium sp.]
MYLRTYNRPKGKYMIITEKYRDPNSGMPKDRTVQIIGYDSDFKDKYADPVAHFRQVVEDMNAEKKERSARTALIPADEELESDTDDLKNVGYGILKILYKELELDKFWKNVTKKMNIQYNADKIFQLLVYSRILFPASKKSTYENRNQFFENFGDFSIDDVYNALTIFGQNEKELQKWIYDHSVTKYHRDLSVGYFDCTNYYYDISKPDVDDKDDEGNLVLERYRKYGPEKNHRKDPIVEMGLLMDKSCIPLAYDLFPGNQSEKVHMLPIINRARTHYGFGRIIIVADRGLNTSDNIYQLNGKNDQEDNPRDGYVYGQSVRGADAKFKEWVLDQKEYVDTKIEIPGEDSDAEDINDRLVFRHKSRIYPKKIQITREKDNGKIVKQSITVDQKQLVYYSKKYAIKQKLERDRTVERARDLIDHPKKYDKVSAKGASGYVINLSFDKDTGEVVGKNLLLDEEKIKEEEKYDGYYSIVTSELKMTDMEIRDTYRGLIHIEDTFKVTKSEFDTRPIYVRTNDHIDAHFTVCFTAIVILRLLETRLDHKYPVGQILNTLRKYGCVPVGSSDYIITLRNDIMDHCGTVFNTNYKYKYRSKQEMRRLLKY